MHGYRLETPRLILRPLSVFDAELAFVWLSDPEVNRFMSYGLYQDVAEVRQWLEHVEQDDSHLIFAFVRRTDGLLIGSGGIHPNPSSEWNLGYNIRRDCWNQGYTTEAVQEILRFARTERGIENIVAQHAAANPASGAVLRKCGMILDHEGKYCKMDGSEVFPALFYRLP